MTANPLRIIPIAKDSTRTKLRFRLVQGCKAIDFTQHPSAVVTYQTFDDATGAPVTVSGPVSYETDGSDGVVLVDLQAADVGTVQKLRLYIRVTEAGQFDLFPFDGPRVKLDVFDPAAAAA